MSGPSTTRIRRPRRKVPPARKRLSEQLIGALLAELGSGRLLEGARFFSNRKICQYWKVSQTTATTALGWLVEQGLISVRNRSGYYLTPEAQQRALFLLYRDGFPRLAAPATWDTRRFTLRFQPVTPRLRIGIILPGQSRQELPHEDAMPPEVRGLFIALRRAQVECRYYIDTQEEGGREVLGGLIRQHGVDGVVAFRRNKDHYLPLEPLIRPLSEMALPVVTVLDDCEGANVISVNLNNIAIGFRAARHFLRHGHRRLGVIYPNEHNAYYFDRVIGCRMAVEGVKGATLLEIPEKELFLSDAVVKAMVGPERPTALFLTSYDQIGAVRALLRRKRLKVPGDVALVICRRACAEAASTALDAMAIPFESIGAKAAACVTALLRGEPIPRSNLINVPLVRAGSVARAAR